MGKANRQHRNSGRWKAFWGFLLPGSLWTHRFSMAWGGCFLTLLSFDIIWCTITNYRPLGFVSTYLFSATLALIMALPTFISHRRWPQLLLLLAVDALLEANLMYCRTYFEAIPPASYLLAGNAAQFSDSITSSLSWLDLLLPSIAIATWIGIGRTQKPDRHRAWRPYLLTLSAAIALCAVTAITHGGMIRHISELKNECYKHAFSPVLYTLPCSFVADLAETIVPVSEEDREFAHNIIKERLALARGYEQKAPVAYPQKRDNLVFIFVESLEAWPIGKKAEGKEITPNINRWISDSTTWYASKVYSQAGTGRSIDGQLLMTTGLFPTSNYVYSMRYPHSTFPSLAKELRHSLGAKSYLLSGDRANTWNQGVVAVSFGIDNPMYRNNWDCSEYFGNTHNPTDKSLFRQIEARMRAGEIWPEGEKALVEIVTYSSHFPFIINPESREISLSDTYPPKLAEYITAINYADSALGQLIGYLRTRSDWDRTMVVIVGDHEGLASKRKEILGNSKTWQALIDTDTYVPLIVLNATIPGHRDEIMGQIDVYSTTLDQMGVTPVWPGLGFSALSPLSQAYASGAPEACGVSGDPAGRVCRIITGQKRAGNAIIAADMLRDNLNY